MTRKQIEERRKLLPTIIDIPWSKWSKYQRRIYYELDCREMINSCLCYGGIDGFWRKFERATNGWRCYADEYIDKLGKKRVVELVEEQEHDFAKATVIRNVYTDTEGISYSTIRWVDE
jgi:hypothetical protein